MLSSWVNQFRGDAPTPPPAGTVDLIYNDILNRWEVDNASDFPSAAWSWEAEDAGILAGEIGTTLDFADAPEGQRVRTKATVGAEVTTSAWVLAPKNDVLAVIDPAALPDGTDILTQGFVSGDGTPTGKIKTRSGKWSVESAISGGEFTGNLIYNAGRSSYRLEVETFIAAVPQNNFNAQLLIGTQVSSSGNYAMRVDVREVATTLDKRAPWPPTTLMATGGGANPNGTIFAVDNVWNAGVLSAKLSRKKPGEGSFSRLDSGGDAGINVNATGSALPESTYFALAFPTNTSAANPSFPIASYGMVRVLALDVNAPVIGSVTWNPAGFESAASFDLSGTCPGAEANCEVILRLANGVEILPPQTVAVVAGVVTANVEYPTEYTSFTIRLRRASDVTSFTEYEIGEVPYSQPYEPMTKGINEGYVAEWAPAAGEKNLVRMGSLRYMDTFDPYCTPAEVGAETDGIIRNWPAGHPAGIRFVLPSAAPVGYYTGTYPAGMTLSFGGDVAGYTITQAPSGGSFELQATQANGKGGTISLTGTIPSGGAQVTIMPKADPHPEKLHYDVTEANYASLGVTAVRFMTPLGVNGNTTYPTSQIYIPGAGSGAATLSIAYIASLCNALSMDCYLAIPHWWTETRARAIAAYLRANLNSGLKVIVEHSNEVFNESNGFWGQVRYHQIEGCKAGLYNTNGDAGTQTILTSGINTSNGYPTTTFNINDIVFSTLDGFGAGLWKAKKAITVGATDKIEAATNTAWELLANPTAINRAKWRFYSVKTRALHNIFLEEFAGQENRIERVVCGQSGNILGDLEISLRWNDLAEHLDRILVAPYFGYNMSSYTDGHFTGWGATEKALVYTNPSAWRDAYFAAVPGVISAMVTQMHNWRAYTGQWLFENYGRAVADRVKTGSYECGAHFDPMGKDNWPNTSTVVEPEYRNLMADARWGTTIQPYYQGLRANGGLQCIFDRIGGTWGLSRNELDVTGSPHIAYANFEVT